MPVILHELALPLDCGEPEVIQRAMQTLRLRPAQVQSAAIARTSVDARRRPILLVHSVELTLVSPELEQKAAAHPKAKLRQTAPLQPVIGTEPMRGRPVIAGFGPAGMFAALLLARQGYRPLVLERGADVDTRTAAVERFWQTGVFDPNSNVQFGEGGAGTFSDGKLVTRINDPRCEWVLQCFAQFGAPAEILTKAKPHIGTDRLRLVVKNIREEIRRLGGEIRFETPLSDLRLRNGQLEAVCAGGEWIETGTLLLAIGHSARDTFALLHEKGIAMEPKPFSVGVRVEHLQSDIDRMLYGEWAGHPLLPPGEYQLSQRSAAGAVYTFCMCPGGLVVPSASEADGLVTNGMSHFARDGKNANAAMVAAVDASVFGSGLFDGMRFQQRLEQAAFAMGGKTGRAPCQTAKRFLEGKPGYDFRRVQPTFARGVADGDFRALFPEPVHRMLRLGLQAFDQRMRGYTAADTVLTGVETRTSSPLRILRDSETLDTGSGIYPCGEGAGYAGGITSAAVDGLRAAEAVIARYAPQI